MTFKGLMLAFSVLIKRMLFCSFFLVKLIQESLQVLVLFFLLGCRMMHKAYISSISLISSHP